MERHPWMARARRFWRFHVKINDHRRLPASHHDRLANLVWTSVDLLMIAAARVIPDVCGVFMSSSPACTILTPCSFQSMFDPSTKQVFFCSGLPRITPGSRGRSKSPLSFHGGRDHGRSK
jgi:hypothetical protein